jgi:hypothetical protein
MESFGELFDLLVCMLDIWYILSHIFSGFGQLQVGNLAALVKKF